MRGRHSVKREIKVCPQNVGKESLVRLCYAPSAFYWGTKFTSDQQTWGIQLLSCCYSSLRALGGPNTQLQQDWWGERVDTRVGWKQRKKGRSMKVGDTQGTEWMDRTKGWVDLHPEAEAGLHCQAVLNPGIGRGACAHLSQSWRCCWGPDSE